MTFTFLLTAPVGEMLEILGLQWVLGAGAQPLELYIVIQRKPKTIR